MTHSLSTSHFAAPESRGYSTSYTVEQSPDEVFDAILDVGSWWMGQVEGQADEVGAEFDYRHPPQHYTRQRVVELVPNRRVVWRVVDSELPFASPPDEWTGTEIVFDLVPVGSGTQLRFTHVGLVPEIACYDACSAGWQHVVPGSLRSRITTGEGLPDPW